MTQIYPNHTPSRIPQNPPKSEQHEKTSPKKKLSISIQKILLLGATNSSSTLTETAIEGISEKLKDAWSSPKGYSLPLKDRLELILSALQDHGNTLDTYARGAILRRFLGSLKLSFNDEAIIVETITDSYAHLGAVIQTNQAITILKDADPLLTYVFTGRDGVYLLPKDDEGSLIQALFKFFIEQDLNNIQKNQSVLQEQLYNQAPGHPSPSPLQNNYQYPTESFFQKQGLHQPVDLGNIHWQQHWQQHSQQSGSNEETGLAPGIRKYELKQLEDQIKHRESLLKQAKKDQTKLQQLYDNKQSLSLLIQNKVSELKISVTDYIQFLQDSINHLTSLQNIEKDRQNPGKPHLPHEKMVKPNPLSSNKNISLNDPNQNFFTINSEIWGLNTKNLQEEMDTCNKQVKELQSLGENKSSATLKMAATKESFETLVQTLSYRLIALQLRTLNPEDPTFFNENQIKFLNKVLDNPGLDPVIRLYLSKVIA